MPRDFFDPPPEELKIVLVDGETLHKAEKFDRILRALQCGGAEIPFDNVLDRVTGSDPSVTHYILKAPAKCPSCRA